MQLSTDQKLDLLLAKVEKLENERILRRDMWDEFNPIIKLALESSSEKLQHWEEKGYFAFAKGLGDIAEKVLENYTPEDVQKLSQSVVTILDTVRSLTQDDVMAIAAEAADAIHTADAKPLGVKGMIKATTDKDVRRGISMMMELLRHVGKGSRTIKTGSVAGARIIPTRNPKQAKLANLLAPKRKAAQINPPEHVHAEASQITRLKIDGYEFDKDGFLLDAHSWNEDLAQKISQEAGIGDLTEDHWELLRFSRTEYLEKKATPNMRKLCTGCNVSAKHVFTLFPKAPAKTIAQIAGVPKPVGCI